MGRSYKKVPCISKKTYVRKRKELELILPLKEYKEIKENFKNYCKKEYENKI
nr:MAG TPA: hypothetical protein [Caudoviricetes sp.]